jgi:hypothetical protein
MSESRETIPLWSGFYLKVANPDPPGIHIISGWSRLSWMHNKGKNLEDHDNYYMTATKRGMGWQKQREEWDDNTKERHGMTTTKRGMGWQQQREEWDDNLRWHHEFTNMINYANFGDIIDEKFLDICLRINFLLPWKIDFFYSTLVRIV